MESVWRGEQQAERNYFFDLEKSFRLARKMNPTESTGMGF